MTTKTTTKAWTNRDSVTMTKELTQVIPGSMSIAPRPVKENKLETWLDTKVKNNDLVVPYASIYMKDAYYFKDTELDIDKNSNEHIINTDCLDHIYIDPSTNRYHANMLFRMLVDYAYESDMDYILHDPETTKPYLKFNLMDRSLKKAFYKFCSEN